MFVDETVSIASLLSRQFVLQSVPTLHLGDGLAPMSCEDGESGRRPTQLL